MKKNTLILGSVIGLAVALLGFGVYRGILVRSMETFQAGVTHEDLEEIFSLLLQDNPDTCCRKTDEPVMYVLENKFVDRSFQLKHPARTIRFISKEEFERLRQSNPNVGGVAITNVTFVRSALIKNHPLVVNVDYGANWYGGDGGHGFCEFTKENGHWVNHGGFSVS